MASTPDRTDHRPGGGTARESGVPLTGRTLALFVGMVATGTLALGLVISGVASLLVPSHEIGTRPYLVSSLAAVLMLFVAVVPALWCGWFWRRVFGSGRVRGGRATPRHPRAVAAAPGSAQGPATPLTELRLPRHVRALLAHAGIETVEQLTTRTQAELLEVRGIGARGLADIQAALHRTGRELRYPAGATRAS